MGAVRKNKTSFCSKRRKSISLLRITVFVPINCAFFSLLIADTLPVTNETAERVTTYLRSSMTIERLSGLGILHTYKETSIDKVINCFAEPATLSQKRDITTLHSVVGVVVVVDDRVASTNKVFEI